ncbi:Deoxyribose-phosphate aldolase [Moelleriella libera RCEF 2490]|uniref:Deoxyribose-phosphate aldolase n=1 Tax=Moelleriella libera RCEF 2490 TaxID=1081109 RepID=A0A166NWP1_9HYPO|nr:Deoxyribose-phosphate aldolase [Moelleriella libera RCEF 2490]
MASAEKQIQITLGQLVKMNVHSLLHPALIDADVLEGLRICKRHNVAAAGVMPYLIPLAKKQLEGINVLVCPVIGFPHGSSTTEVKVYEARTAVLVGGKEVDMVINIGKPLGGDWDDFAEEIREINAIVTAQGAILKVIFKNDFLQNEYIARLCGICSDIEVAFIKTSRGYGFVKGLDGRYAYKGATARQLKIMRQSVRPDVQLKAAGGVRNLDDLLRVAALGVTRVGATATVAILQEAVEREESRMKQ